MNSSPLAAVVGALAAAFIAGFANADDPDGNEGPKYLPPFLDPRLDAADIPRAPDAAVRIELLDIVTGIREYEDRVPAGAVKPAEELDASLARLSPQEGLSESFAYLIVTQPALGFSAIDLMVDKIARMGDPRGLRWLGVIYRVAPTLSHRFLENGRRFEREVLARAGNPPPSSALAELLGSQILQPGSEEERLVLKGFTSTMRAGIERTARRYQIESLLAELERIQRMEE